MILGIVQSGEVSPVILDFGAVSHVETDGAKDGFHPLPSLDHGMNATEATTTARQSDVDGLSGQTAIKLRLLEFRTASVEQRFDLLLQLDDPCTLFQRAFRVPGYHPVAIV